MNWLTAVQIPAFVFLFYFFTVYIVKSFPTLQGRRICILIAHPDDEAMFMSPLLLALSKPELGNLIFLLCLSSGNADGLGNTRKAELRKSALQLGITSSEHVVVLEDEKLPDSMTTSWDAKLISGILTRYFAPRVASTPTTMAPEALIDVLITFDKNGVSGHPNHTSLYHGSVAFLKDIMQRHSGWDCPVKFYTLTSVNIVRKYCSVIDSVLTVLTCIWRKKERSSFPTPLLFVSGPGDVRKAQLAMATAHKSQMRWFRWGWIGISRYMIVNDLTKQKVA